MEIHKTFGESINSLREGKNLTLREVAEELEIDTSMLGKIEKNSRKPTIELIEKLSKLFNVPKKELTINFLSDTIVYKIMDSEDYAQEVLKAAEKKIEYLITKRNA